MKFIQKDLLPQLPESNFFGTTQAMIKTVVVIESITKYLGSSASLDVIIPLR